MKYLRLLRVFLLVLVGIFVIIPFFLPQFSLFLSSLFSIFLPRLGQFYEYDNAPLKRKNIKLEQKLNFHNTDQALFDILKKENNNLRKLLKLSIRKEYTYINAEVVARNALTWKQNFVINAGTKQGVKEGCGVISNGFLVGQVVKVTENSAVVHTLLHPNIKISCEVQNLGGVGILSGEFITKEFSETYGYIKYLSRELKLPKDTVFVTSGLGNLIPRGIKIGQLIKDFSNELTKEAYIRFFASFNKIYFVSVVMPN